MLPVIAENSDSGKYMNARVNDSCHDDLYTLPDDFIPDKKKTKSANNKQDPEQKCKSGKN